MSKRSRALGAAIGLCCALIAAGCEAPTTTSTTNVNINAAPTPAAAPTAPAAEPARANAANYSVTLPVLDAFFAEESFAGELKSKLQLSDEQIAKLRTVAREETARLRESDNEEYGGTTDAARALYQQKIEAEIGAEKARALSELVLARWNGGEGPGEIGDAPAGGKSGGIPSDTRIVVNAPAYRMDVFENGQLTKSYRIGIGYPEFPLPTGVRRADTIIFNPTWTPPDEPWVEAPSSKVKVGQKVEAGSPLNPLGPVKIPIGLPSLIHGGKQPARLGNFASHGCVGLTNTQVQEFAQTLAKLAGTELTPEQIAEYQKNKTETKNVKLEKTIPVELRYDTIVVEDGKLHLYRDVYDRGTNTEENLRGVLAAHDVNFEQLSEAERGQITDALRRMARDATGKPAAGQPDASATPTAKNTNGNKNESGKVTRNVKGEKEVVIELAALAGKGYPAPVDLNTGGAPNATGKKGAARAKR